jgi:hypothetical protein
MRTSHGDEGRDRRLAVDRSPLTWCSSDAESGPDGAHGGRPHVPIRQEHTCKWRYRAHGDRLTYRVVFAGERASIHSDAGTPLVVNSSYAVPRLDDTFTLLDELVGGNAVGVTYDERLGYPRRIELPFLAGTRATVTITDFRAR